MTSTPSLSVLGISGSLRRGSLNTALLRAAALNAPAGVTVETYDALATLPPYDGDRDGDAPPAAVVDLRRRIAHADGLLIATPEYNYSIPGVLKNAIDWASRPVGDSALEHKPVATMGASPGRFGTVRAQLALRQVWVWTDSIPVVKPEVLVTNAAERFDADGRLVDADTASRLTDLLSALADLIVKHQ